VRGVCTCARQLEGVEIVKYEIGQSVIVSHRPRRHVPPTTIAGTVVNIGRKYVTVLVGHSERKFSISTGEEKTDYSPDYTVWPSMRVFEDNEEAMELRKKLRDLFTSYTNVAEMNLDKLRRIKAIIDEH
jgi:hypothetical protein